MKRLAVLLSVFAWCASALSAEGGGEAKTVALLIKKPASLGWTAFSKEDSLRLACGIILKQSLAETQGLRQIEWQETSPIALMAESGLIILAGESRHAQWKTFVDADIMAEFTLSDEAMAMAVHSAAGSKEESFSKPYAQPKKAIATFIKMIFSAAGIQPSAELLKKLDNPEAKKGENFIAWAGWQEFSPSPYNDSPWDKSNLMAAKLLREEPGFSRGVAWAALMRLKPFGAQNSGGARKTTRDASTDFDLFCFHALASDFAEPVIEAFRKRMEKNQFLRQQAIKHLSLSDLESAGGLPADEGDGLAKDDAPKEGEGAPPLASTPQLRRNLIACLSGCAAPEVLAAILAVAENDTDATVRLAAVESLPSFDKQPAKISAAVTAATKDQDATVRLAAVIALDRLGKLDEATAKQLLADKSPLVQAKCADSLARRKPDSPDAAKAFTTLLASTDTEARLAALRTLDIFGARLATTSEAGASKTTEYEGEKNIAAMAKACPELVAAVGKCLSSESLKERLAAIAVATRLKTPELCKQLEARLEDASGQIRACAAALLAGLKPDSQELIAQKLAKDQDPQAQMALARALSATNKLDQLKQLAASAKAEARAFALSTLYAKTTDQNELTRLMLSDPSMRVNFAGIRRILRSPEAVLVEALAAIATEHANSQTKVHAMDALAKLKYAKLGEVCAGNLASPFWQVRLRAASHLARGGENAAAVPAIEKAMKETKERFLTMALEDALAACRKAEPPKRTALNLGKRERTEGGELPEGWQVWLSAPPLDNAEAAKRVAAGFRYGTKVAQSANKDAWGLQTWDDSEAQRNDRLIEYLDLFNSPDWIKNARFFYYLCLFDEPMSPSGGEVKDMLRAFVLDCGRPELLEKCSNGKLDELPPELVSAYAYWRAKMVANISNWAVGLCRDTVQREFPGLRIFPQSLSYMDSSNFDAFADIDADGDYTWSYRHDNLLGDYGLGAVNRALRPGQPVCQITWNGWYNVSMFTTDAIYPDTPLQPGPWRLRGYMGIKSALALYASGVEPGFFNYIGYKPVSHRGRDTGGVQSFPLTPWSKELATTVENMLKDNAYWKNRSDKISGELFEKKNKEKKDTALGESENEEDSLESGESESALDKRLRDEREKLFASTMENCSWMNIFDTDMTRALANLPKPDTSRRNSLAILSRNREWNADLAHFPMAAMALLDGFDLLITHEQAAAADLSTYDTIVLKESPEGTSAELAAKLNAWLASKQGGLLVVCGNLDSSKLLFPFLTGEKAKERFAWEETVTVQSEPRTDEPILDKNKKPTGKTKSAAPQLKSFKPAGGSDTADEETRLRCSYKGSLAPLAEANGKIVLARWKAPESVKAAVLFDGIEDAGPVYTEALEKAILAIDKERGSKVKRNPYWGHVGTETPQFTIDVAGRGYDTLLAARPRQHKGVDVITGVVNPSVAKSESALILTDYVGPYAGGKGDWAVMARSELKEMKLIDATHLRVQAKGVTRVTHIGDAAIAIQDAAGFTEVKNQLEVWQAHWKGTKAFSRNQVEGGQELHFTCPDAIVISTAGAAAK